MASDTEITKVRIVIRHLLWQIREIRNDRDAAWKWVNRFANTLQYQELEQDPDQYALAILAEARSFNDQQRRKGQMLGVRKQLAKEGVTNPTQEQLDEKWLEMYGNETTADGDTREDSQAKHNGSAITRNETRAHDALEPSANIYGPRQANNGVAPHREAGDVSATDSRNMRRVPQNEAPAHGFSGGRTAQGTMSRSPEAAAQSGKAYDQETYQVSTDEARQSQARESRRTGGSSVRGMAKVAQPSVRSRASFRNKEDFIQWAIDDGLDPVDAGECWEATEERHGKDADGNTVKNMKAFARQWCRTRKDNRRTA